MLSELNIRNQLFVLILTPMMFSCATTQSSREPCACTSLKDIPPAACPVTAAAEVKPDLGSNLEVNPTSAAQLPSASTEAAGQDIAATPAASINPAVSDIASPAAEANASPTPNETQVPAPALNKMDPEYVAVDQLGPDVSEPAVTISPSVQPFWVNIAALNVRSGPSMEFPVVRTLRKGEQVAMQQREGIWARIGDNEYVSLHYLSDQKKSVTH